MTETILRTVDNLGFNRPMDIGCSRFAFVTKNKRIIFTFVDRKVNTPN